MNGKQLSNIREQLKWTQAKLGDAVGVTSNTVARWERDEMAIGEPAARLILRIQAEQKAKPKTRRR